ncbi:hypothetical protein ACRAWD_30225 [Caulobacter segnis]
MSNLAAGLAAAMMSLAAVPAMAQPEKQTSIVLVHGAFSRRLEAGRPSTTS